MTRTAGVVLGVAVAAIAVMITATGHAAAGASRTAHTAEARPPIRWHPIPYGAARRREMAAYAERHYGIRSYRLRHPRVIVEHYTGTSSAASTFSYFANDVADPELGELPAVCSHFLVDRDGRIEQLVPIGLMCRHTVGLNYTAVGIEHVGRSDAQVLGDPAQLAASIALTRWLRCRLGIAVRNVIGHNESLSSPYHREREARFRRQTHGDFARPAMRRYRTMLAAGGATCGQSRTRSGTP